MVTKQSVMEFISTTREKIANADAESDRFVAAEKKRIMDQRAASPAHKRMGEIRASIRRKPQ